MKYLKPFNESKTEELVTEILSKPGWVKIEPTRYEHWINELEYQLTDDVKITVLQFDPQMRRVLKDGKDIQYYLEKGDDFYIIGSYTNNYTQLFSEYEYPYRDLSNYERMMKTCNYLLPFFYRKPDDNLINSIRECFIEIEDYPSIEFELKWGYCDAKNEEFGFFPAFRFSDKLALSLVYNLNGAKIEDIDDILESGKERLISIYDIHHSYIKVINDGWRRIIIRIE